MSNGVGEQFACSACGMQYPWQVELVGKSVRCKCGEVFNVPRKGPPPLPATDDYELSEQIDPLHSGRCPSCACELKVAAVVCVNCGFNIKQGKHLETAVGQPGPDEAEGQTACSTPAERSSFARHTLKQAHKEALARAEQEADWQAKYNVTQIYVPLVLVGIGLTLILIDAFLLPSTALLGRQIPSTTSFTNLVRRLMVLAKSFFQVAMQAPFLFIGILVVAKMFGTSFGNLVPALLKLMAIALMLVGLDNCLNTTLHWLSEGFGFIGLFLTFTVNLIVFYGLAIWLYELDVMETLALWVFAFFVPMLIGGFIFLAIVASLSY